MLGALSPAGLVWAYDLKLKSTLAGAAAMAGNHTAGRRPGAYPRPETPASV
ncbi:hypothetical protein [Streptomyces montanus]|uniref:hypothetical protein n=1 Tax=Streptomyces montanus TaxID=2580423 RepID=UPI00148691FB|nr:hypothetical protein [Streptomyces montanus]